MNTDVITPESQEEVLQAIVVSPEQKAIEKAFSQDIIAYSIPELAIQLMEEEFLPMTVQGAEDKKGFDLVHKCRMITKDQRLFVEKARVRMKAPALEFGRKVDEGAKKLINRLEAIEDHLGKQEKAYTDERERIAEAKAEAERQRYQGRVLQLKDWGFKFDDVLDTYQLGEMIINKDDIRDLSDDDYAPTIELAKKAVEAEQQRLADEKLKDERAADRIKQLRAWGFVWNPSNEFYSFTDGLGVDHFDVCPLDLKELSDGAYEPIASTAKRVYDAEQTRLAEIQKEADKLKEANRIEAERLQGIADDQAAAQKLIDDQRKQLEDDRRKMILNGRTPLLEAAGFEFTGNRFKLGTTIKLGQEDIVDMADQQFADLLVDAEAKIKEDTAAKIEADRLEKVRINNEKKANKERTARLAPDKKALKKWAIRLGNFPLAETTQDEASALATSFIGRLSIMAKEFAIEIDAL